MNKFEGAGLDAIAMPLEVMLEKLLNALEIYTISTANFNREYYRFDFHAGKLDFSISANSRGLDIEEYRIPILEEILQFLTTKATDSVSSESSGEHQTLRELAKDAPKSNGGDKCANTISRYSIKKLIY